MWVTLTQRTWLCVSMCELMCTCVSEFMCICACVFVCICVPLYVCLCLCFCVCVSVYKSVYQCVYMHVCVFVFLCICVCVCLCMSCTHRHCFTVSYLLLRVRPSRPDTFHSHVQLGLCPASLLPASHCCSSNHASLRQPPGETVVNLGPPCAWADQGLSLSSRDVEPLWSRAGSP